MRKAISLFIVSILSFLHFQVTAQFSNTQLQNVTNRSGEEYRQVQFADLDNDGDQDLIVLRETLPYLIFKKEGTEFVLSDSITFDNEFLYYCKSRCFFLTHCRCLYHFIGPSK